MYEVQKLQSKPKDPNEYCPSIKIKGRYVNPWPSSKTRAKSDFWRTLYRVTTRKSFKKLPEENYVKVDVDLDTLNGYTKEDKDVAMQLTWFGHAATFLQINGFNILFDPLLNERASPFTFIGPYRYRKRGFKSFSEFPKIDILVISHNHYDHLDKRTIKELLKEPKNRNLHIFCPMGLKKWFLKRFDLLNTQITEGDWWDDFEIIKYDDASSETTLYNDVDHTTCFNSHSDSISTLSLTSCVTSLLRKPSNSSNSSQASNHSNSSNNTTISLNSIISFNKDSLGKKKIQISCVPAQHSSRRNLIDGNKSLWAGWVIKSEEASFYFAGDTGYRAIPENCSNEDRSHYPYCPFFAQIGKAYGPFDYACIPIGPANNSNSVTAVHVDATDAINIHKDIQSKHSIPIHWGTVANYCTVKITDDPRRLRKEMQNSGLPLEEFDIAYIGEVFKLYKKSKLDVKLNPVEDEQKQEQQQQPQKEQYFSKEE